MLCGRPAQTFDVARRWRPVRTSYGLDASFAVLIRSFSRSSCRSAGDMRSMSLSNLFIRSLERTLQHLPAARNPSVQIQSEPSANGPRFPNAARALGPAVVRPQPALSSRTPERCLRRPARSVQFRQVSAVARTSASSESASERWTSPPGLRMSASNFPRSSRALVSSLGSGGMGTAC